MTKVAFVSHRLKGPDGVSGEIEKWIGILCDWNLEVCRLAGKISNPEENDYIISQLDFKDPEIEHFNSRAFFPGHEEAPLEREFTYLAQKMRQKLVPLLKELDPDIVVAANIFSLPLNIPLSVVLCEYLEQEHKPCIALHYNFYWQAQDMKKCIFDDLITNYFPPFLPNVTHVVSNMKSREYLYQNTGITANCIYQCVDFDNVRGRDEFNSGLRSDLGLDEDELVLLQPTPVRNHRSLERLVFFIQEFIQAGGRKTRLLITGPCQEKYLHDFQKICKCSDEILDIYGWLGACRNQPGAASVYDIHDAYACSDFVALPNSDDGLGDPVLESVRHLKPLFVNGYYLLEELRSYGFQFLELDSRAVQRVIKLLEHPALIEEMVARNLELGKRYFSIDILKEQIAGLVAFKTAIVY